MKLIYLLFLSFSSFALADKGCLRMNDYNLDSLSPAKTELEAGFCYAHATATVLEIELRQAGKLNKDLSVSPESIALLNQFNQDYNSSTCINCTKFDLKGNISKRIFENQKKNQKTRKQFYSEFYEGGDFDIFSLIKENGFCFAHQLEDNDTKYLLSHKRTIKFYERLNKVFINERFDGCTLNRSVRFKDFFPDISTDEFIDILKIAQENDYNYHKAFIKKQCEQNKVLLTDFKLEIIDRTKDFSAFVEKNLKDKKPIYVGYDATILLNGKIHDGELKGHASAIIGLHTECIAGKAKEYVILKDAIDMKCKNKLGLKLGEHWRNYKKISDEKEFPGFFCKNGFYYIQKEILISKAMNFGVLNL